MKTVVFDFDGTLTKKSNEIWRNIWVKLDATDIDDMLYNKVKSGELKYEDWTKEITKEYIKRGFNKTTLNELTNNIQMMNNLEIALKELKNKGYDLRILSGGIDYVIEALLKDNIQYFSDIRCNKFVFDKDGYLLNIIDTDSDHEGKGRYVRNLIQKYNCDPKDIIFVGNGNNDRFVASTGCITLCINPNGTNHLDKNVWNLYIEDSDDLLDVVKVINNL